MRKGYGSSKKFAEWSELKLQGPLRDQSKWRAADLAHKAKFSRRPSPSQALSSKLRQANRLPIAHRASGLRLIK
jgi:hypothetical protein